MGQELGKGDSALGPICIKDTGKYGRGIYATRDIKTGELIAAPPDGKLGACIHASISGRVVSVDSDILIERG